MPSSRRQPFAGSYHSFCPSCEATLTVLLLHITDIAIAFEWMKTEIAAITTDKEAIFLLKLNETELLKT